MRRFLNKTAWVLSSVGTVIASGVAWAQDTAEAKGITEVTQEQLSTAKKLVDLIIEICVKYSFQVLGGVVVLIIGWIVGGYLAGVVRKFLDKKNIDVTVIKFIASAVKIIVITFAVIIALGKFGIEIAPFIAGISVAGFGLTFALQGPLSNYVAGAVLIFTKPFKVGDIIEVAEVNGEVQDLTLARTELKTVDGDVIVVPNKHIIGEIIHNFSENKRLDIKVGVSYGADVDRAINIVRSIIVDDTRVIRGPHVGISEFADSSINIYARLWCKQDQYWNVLFSLNRKIFEEFKKNGIEIPFPQRDVHIFNAK